MFVHQMVTVLHVLLYSVPVSVLRLAVSTSHSLHSSVHQKVFPITQQFPHTFQHGSHKMEKKNVSFCFTIPLHNP